MTKQEQKNLERELALVASAWYSLTGRLQMSHVSVKQLQRRRSASPRSWLSKQRKLMSQSTVPSATATATATATNKQ